MMDDYGGMRVGVVGGMRMGLDHLDQFCYLCRYPHLIFLRSCLPAAISCQMSSYNCRCGGCKGKSVSKSTFFSHAQRRRQEDLAELELQGPILPPEEDEEDIDMTYNGPDMG